MRTLATLVILFSGCSESKKQETPAAAPSPTKPAVEAPAPAPPSPTPAPAAPRRNAENEAALTISGEWSAKLEGGGAHCRFNNDPKERAIDRGARIKVDTKKLGLDGRFVAFSISTDGDGKVTLIQVDVTTDEDVGKTAPGAKRMLTYTMHEKGAKVTKAEVAPDGSSATVDATLASTKKDGKTVQVTGTVTCKKISSLAF